MMVAIGVAAGFAVLWWLILLSHLATIANGVQRLAAEAEKERPKPSSEPQRGPQWPARFDQ